MSKRNRMPGLRQKGGIWHIEKRSKYTKGGWLRESTGETSRPEAEAILIRRLAEIEEEAQRKAEGVYSFEETALRYPLKISPISLLPIPWRCIWTSYCPISDRSLWSRFVMARSKALLIMKRRAG